jgi:hypothetical protein
VTSGEQPPAPLVPQRVVEQGPDILEKRRRLDRIAFLVRRTPREEEHLRRTRSAQIEEEALLVEDVLLRPQPDAGYRRERPAIVVAEKRLGTWPQGKRAVLQPAHEDRPEPPGSDGHRV